MSSSLDDLLRQDVELRDVRDPVALDRRDPSSASSTVTSGVPLEPTPERRSGG